MVRIISQAGDSTDEEDYEEVPNKNSKENIVERLNKYQDLDYNVSCILKEIGNQLLQSTEVRTKYGDIKEKFTKTIEPDQIKKMNTWDQQLGRCWGVIITKYDKEKQEVLPFGASYYFDINKEKIENTCNKDPVYLSLDSEAKKANYYLKEKVKIQDNFKNIYKLNKLTEEYAQKQRSNIEYLEFNDSDPIDASLFLAKIKASKKLDKDLGKNHLCDYIYGTGRFISNTSITKKTTQQNEIFEVCRGGAFKHLKTNEGTYETIGKELKKLISKKFIDLNRLKEFFQSYLKGKIVDSIIKEEELRDELIAQLKTDVELIFGIEVKRNSAALLTNAMFFDLVDKGIYKIEQIADKMPMAMEGAVSASTTIDKKIGKLAYDYREKSEASKAKLLLTKDKNILQDWLKCKLEETLDKTVETMGNGTTLQELRNCFNHLNINVEGKGRTRLMTDEHMVLNSNDNIFCEGKVQWDNNKSKIKSTVGKVLQVKAKDFYDLIFEWYGIKLPNLNKLDMIQLKAAAEPEDPKEDSDHQDDFKVLVKYGGDSVSETGFQYKQKYVLNHSKIKASVDKMDYNKMTIDKVKETINKALSSEELIYSLGKLFCPTDKNQSPDEIMSCLKAALLGWESSGETIHTKKLNRIDPNKPLLPGNIIIKHNFFYKILDRVNGEAIENNREDILATLQKYSYNPQEQMDIIGDTGI